MKIITLSAMPKRSQRSVSQCLLAAMKLGHLKEAPVNWIVKAAAKRVPGFELAVAETVSPQELRHAHASHAIDRGAPVHKRQGNFGSC